MPLTLGICELFHPKIHGNTSSSSSTINLHYIVNCLVDPDDFMTNSRYKKIDLQSMMTRCEYESDLDHLITVYNKINTRNNRYIKHPIIENYDFIIRKNNYIRVEIIEMHTLVGMEEIAVLKTHWIRLVQRKWKKLYKIKMEKIKRLMSWNNLRKRELYGR
jgi:hypothetical protein